MRGEHVLPSLGKYFLLGLSARQKIAIQTNISAIKLFVHCSLLDEAELSISSVEAIQFKYNYSLSICKTPKGMRPAYRQAEEREGARALQTAQLIIIFKFKGGRDFKG